MGRVDPVFLAVCLYASFAVFDGVTTFYMCFWYHVFEEMNPLLQLLYGAIRNPYLVLFVWLVLDVFVMTFAFIVLAILCRRLGLRKRGILYASMYIIVAYRGFAAVRNFLFVFSKEFGVAPTIWGWGQ